MGRPKVSSENRARVISFSADKKTNQLIEELEAYLGEKRSRILVDAVICYHDFIMSEKNDAKNTY